VVLYFAQFLVLAIGYYERKGSLTGWYYPHIQQGVNQISDQLSAHKNETVKTNKMFINLLRQLNDVTRTTPDYDVSTTYMILVMNID
jgi:hypothetical protein